MGRHNEFGTARHPLQALGEVWGMLTGRERAVWLAEHTQPSLLAAHLTGLPES